MQNGSASLLMHCACARVACGSHPRRSCPRHRRGCGANYGRRRGRAHTLSVRGAGIGTGSYAQCPRTARFDSQLVWLCCVGWGYRMWHWLARIEAWRDWARQHVFGSTMSVAIHFLFIRTRPSVSHPPPARATRGPSTRTTTGTTTSTVFNCTDLTIYMTLEADSESLPLRLLQTVKVATSRMP